MSADLRVAVAGLGTMGTAMVGTLVKAGYAPVLWNRTAKAAEAIGGGLVVAPSAAAAAESVDVIISSLADDDAVRRVYLGEDGVVAGAQPGLVAVDTSTVDPLTAREVAEAFAGSGAFYLDAPVSGSVPLVLAAGLTVMVGGEATALERARPVLDALAKAVYHMGDNGAGATIKLAVNALVHATNTAIAEALVLAEASGVDRELAYEVFANGAGASPFLLYKQDAFLRPEDAPVAFSLDLVAKDLRLIVGLADRSGVPMQQALTNLTLAEAAIESGLGTRDMSIIAEHLRG